MNINRVRSAFAFAVLLVAVLACNVSTANLSALKIGKDKDVSQETSSFSPGDIVYGVATVSNAPGKVKVKGRLVVEEVPGQETGPVPGLEKTIDLEGSGNATFTFTPPTRGWPAGRYKLEVFLLNDQGEQKDTKSATFSVS